MPNANPGAQQAAETASEIDAMVLGLAPAVAAASVYCSLAQSTSILYDNAVAQQKSQTISAGMLTLGGILNLLAMTDAATNQAEAEIDPDAELIDLLKALKNLN